MAGTPIQGCGGQDEPLVDGIDESFLDRSVSPCTDFYQFACGTWIAEHPTDKAPAVQRFFEGEGRTAYLLDKILEGDRKGMPYVLHDTSAILGSYYGACMTSRASTTVEHAAAGMRLAEIEAASSSAELAQVVRGGETPMVIAPARARAARDNGLPPAKDAKPSSVTGCEPRDI